MDEGFFDDDGTPLCPDLAPVPSLCVVCRRHDDPRQEKLCAINRLDQSGKDEFRCDSFSSMGGDGEGEGETDASLHFT